MSVFGVTFGIPAAPAGCVVVGACCRLLWLPCICATEVSERAGTGGRRGGTIVWLLFSCDERSSRFSRSSAACCSFSSLMADISSSFCVSSDECDSISWFETTGQQELLELVE